MNPSVLRLLICLIVIGLVVFFSTRCDTPEPVTPKELKKAQLNLEAPAVNYNLCPTALCDKE